MPPPIRNDRVGNEFHGPKLLFNVGDRGCISKEHGRSVVVVMTVGGKSQNQPVKFCGCDADGETFSI